MRGAILTLAFACLAACGCREGEGASSPEAAVMEPLFSQRGCLMSAHEYYGWHYAMRCDPWSAGRHGKGTPPVFLGTIGTCNLYAHEHYGWRPFARCDGYPETQSSGKGGLTEPPEHLFTVDGWSVFRFEYYGWHAFAMYDGGPFSTGKLSARPEYVHGGNGCRSWYFEYYGPHALTVCDGKPAGAGSVPVETIGADGPCVFERFEYYGWHDYVRCQGKIAAFVSTQAACSQTGAVAAIPIAGPNGTMMMGGAMGMHPSCPPPNSVQTLYP